LGQYRNKLQIIADILAVVRNGARKTRIMYQANLSYRLLNEYLGYVMETDLIMLSSEDKVSYIVTPKGFEFLEKYNKYSQRSKQLEEQLQDIADEKTALENNYAGKSVNSNHKVSLQSRTKQ
jgi:predicted transcriptional regulator